MITRIREILDRLRNADLSVLDEGKWIDTDKEKLKLFESNTKFLSDAAKILLEDYDEFDSETLDTVYGLLNICNILYNNTDLDPLPVEDGVYDLLLEKFKSQSTDFQVGAEPIIFKETYNISDTEQTLINPISFVDDEHIMNMLFAEDIIDLVPPPSKNGFLINPINFNCGDIDKRVRNTKHEYPELVGTLDKCKYVLCSQAEEKGVLNNDNVKILERDFFQKHIEAGIIGPDEKFGMVLELKYDGISVEAEVTNQIISARTRGDANESLAADITPILYGYRFKHAPNLSLEDSFGMKFEAIITYGDLYKYNLIRGKNYKNCRTAISSIFSSSDAYLYKDFITLVPLATSLIHTIDMDENRLTEIQFMNEFYHSGEYLRFAYVEGDYKQILFLIKKFVEEAEYSRDLLPFMYDGVVVSYIDPIKKQMLGRKNAINKWSMAIKFNPLKKQTIFRGFTYSVGQNGAITPMIHYDPVEFMGTIHDHSTGSSYDRFMKLRLREGDIIDVEYVNDVMPYVTKPSNSYNGNNLNPIIPFIEECPSCHSKLETSESGKTISCPNIRCPERNMSRMINLLDKLNLRDFSESAIEGIMEVIQMDCISLVDLMNIKLSKVAFLGENDSVKFMNRINELKTQPIYDFKIVGALGFTGIANEKWKTILNKFFLSDLLGMNHDELRGSLLSIKGVGPTTVDVICNEIEFFMNDLMYILNMSNVIATKGMKFGKSIRFTGVRDKDLMEALNDMGHDASEGGVTQTTDILLVPTATHESSKTKKVGPNTQIVPIEEFRNNMDKYLNVK